MPITKDTYENFYLANGAEHKIMSEIFLHGFEAHKFNPDIGIDLLVTNKALRNFKGVEESTHYLQIKSTFLINGEAVFFIDKDELDFLKGDKNIAMVFCYFSPVIAAEPKSYDRGDFEPWRDSEDASFMMHLYETRFRELRKDGGLSQFDFKGFKMGYIWLNNKQLNKALDEGYIIHAYDNLNKMVISDIEAEPLAVKGKDSNGHLISELKNVYYLLKENQTSSRLEDGCFLFEHC